MNELLHLRYAYEIARDSPDPSTQNGAFIRDEYGPLFSTFASNTFTDGVAMNNERWERPAKYSFVEHAERGAIYKAARRGIRTEGLEMVAAWAACADCARAVVQAGIVRLIRHNPPNRDEGAERWLASIEIGDTIMREGGVEIVDVTDALSDAPVVLRDGKMWRP